MRRFLTTFFVCCLCATSLPAQFWTQVNTQSNDYRLASGPADTVYGLTSSWFLYRSEMDGTGNWNLQSGYPQDNSYTLFYADGRIFLSNGDGVDFDGLGIYISDDAGATWTTSNNGLGQDLNMVGIFPLANGVLLAQTRTDVFTYNIYRSTDNGDSWTFLEDIGGGVAGTTVLSANEIYMSTFSKVWKSTDNGLTWADLNATIPSNSIYTILPGNNNNLIATSNVELIESTDGGVTWSEINTSGLPSVSVGRRAFVKSTGGDFYVATDTINGIYVSTDGGTTWASAGTGTGTNSTQVFPGDMMISSNGYLFASPSNSGIYRSMLPVQNNVSAAAPLQNGLSFGLFPNPNSGSFRMEFHAEKAGEYGFRVYSLNGVEVYAATEKVGVGQQDVAVEANLAPGMYLVELQGNGARALGKVLVRK